jgi:hypothetical protein
VEESFNVLPSNIKNKEVVLIVKFDSNFIGIMVIIAIFIATPAYAYLDPGTGSAILQGILGALAAVAVVTKLYWYRILRFLGLSKKGIELERKIDSSEKKS